MSELLTAVAILFLVAGPFLLVANHFDLPTVPFLILAGVVAGPFVDPDLTLELAQYGIALLVFSFGLGIQLSAVRTVLADSEVAAVGQIIVVGGLGVGLGVAFGVPLEEAVFLGIAAALSSTIVGTALLQAEIRNDLVRGRLTESIQFVQDMLAILFLLVLGASALAIDPIATQLGLGVILIVAAIVVNRYVFDRVGRLAGGSDELMIVGVVSLLVVFIGLAALFDVSIVVGAFAAGLAVRHDPGQYLGLFNALESIKDFFVAIFFVTVGALVAFPTVEKLLLVIGLVVLTAIVKPIVTAVILIYRGHEARSSFLAGFTLDQVSEFALIIAIEAFILGFVTQLTFDAIIFAAAVTMITSSLTQQYGEEIYRRIAEQGLITGRHDRIDEWSDVPEDLSGHVIVVGYGIQGRRLVRICEELDQPYVVVENDPTLRETAHTECDAVVFGDAMERYTWEKANVEDATLIVSTIDSDPVSDRILEYDFEADVILRVGDIDRALELFDAGVLYVITEDLLASERLIEYLIALLDGDISPESFREERRSEFEARLSNRRNGHPGPMAFTPRSDN